MRAVRMKKFGPPEVLEPAEVPAPVAGEGQVLIEVVFASITFVETQVRSGRLPFLDGTAILPIIPGNGVGGVVRSVGEDIASELVGRRVISTTGGSGGYAEQVAVDAAGVVEVPDGLATDVAVALLADGRTAMALCRAAAPRQGERVLIEAAGGGVGTLLVQLARDAGATVIAAAGFETKLDQARELGAEFTIDYSAPGWADLVRDMSGDVDIVFDGIGGDLGRTAFDLLASGGRMYSFGIAAGAFPDVDDEQAAQRGITVHRGVPVSPVQARELTLSALSRAADGQLRPIIGQRFPLNDAARAHTHIENRATVGKTLLVL
ncbi:MULTISPECIES: zinc-binding dehydrogenase [unclassified Actinopolyspora]|uniref:zinc-binding dehydrogenase n=1 Tax=unclassified Actinopolyspora TaxID=2639451 RepID=UPI0013F6315C|nr:MULTISPECIES: zinc-binding dehydrogenase [unclassified Actinopolyspora]NHD19315.1 zinc-binding dehydrogenase [Actinopolyspora sp. BKK2]NHE78439.1 zinc-binding dehydrogenase [Actinopolyspora sp. BKK1]